MKKSLVLTTVFLTASMLFSACAGKTTAAEQTTVAAETQNMDTATEPADTEAQDSEAVQDTTESDTEKPAATTPDGDIVDGASTTQENPVPLGTWASVTITDGGWPKNAYARILNVTTDPAQTQPLIDAYDAENPDDKILALEEHAEFLEYVVVEYEVYFPEDFTDSERITFWGIKLTRENNQEDWIASDGSDYYWMGSETIIDAPSKSSGYPKNGDTVQCKVAYPMIKDYTDYTLHYTERNVELTESLNTYFALK